MPHIGQVYDARWFVGIRRKLLRWYSTHQRQLPWRDTNDPYRIWVSEIMLQQTQVATVVDYYRAFLLRFPNIDSLAAADESQVLALWSGLGYYRRALQLHAAAKRIVAEHAGVFPTKFGQILALPGIGRYTAGAIASFAYDARKPILEANTQRLFSRLLVLRENPTSPNAQQKLWDFAEQLLPARKGAGRVNQACMDLGSMICVPGNPKCDRCPLGGLCPCFKQGLQSEIPAAKPKPKFEEQLHALVVIRRRGRYLMRKNERGEWWTGLWDFPRTEITAAKSWSAEELKHDQGLSERVLNSVMHEFAAKFELQCQPRRWIRTMRHGVTRYKIKLHCFEATVESGFRPSNLSGCWKWADPHSAADLPLTSTARKLSDWLAKSKDSP